jgi:hypothetical protein
MSNYYLNASSTTENGFTPQTGYHTLKRLMTNVTLDNGDTIYLVGNIIEINQIRDFIIDVNVSFDSWSGNANKPIWHLYNNGFSCNNSLLLQNINMIGTYQINVISGHIIIKKCIIDGINVWCSECKNITIQNNIFKNQTWDVIDSWSSINGWDSISITNNIFYNFSFSAITIIDVLGDKQILNAFILNNVFYLSMSITSPIEWITSDTVINCLIDHNLFYQISSPDNYLIYPADLNIVGDVTLSADPGLVNPISGDFTLEFDSPCINAGVNNADFSAVPVDDFIGTLRPSGVSTDIGPYELILVSTTVSADSTYSDSYVSPYYSPKSGGIPNYSNVDVDDQVGSAFNMDNYGSENEVFRNVITEAFNHHGICMIYYIISYDPTYDRVFGEDCDKTCIRQFEFMGRFPLQQEEKIWSRFSIEGIDNFVIYISKDHLRVASTYGHDVVAGNIDEGTYDAYIPQVGDIVQSKYNDYLYEVINVKEHSIMYHLNQRYIWELTVKPFTDYGISLSADTILSMGDLSANINKGREDIFNISADLAEKITSIEYPTSADVVPVGDPFGGW